MELKKSKEIIWLVDYNDWDRFVNDYFGFENVKEKYGYRGFPYEFCADHEANNDSKYSFTAGYEWSDNDYAERSLRETIKRVEKWVKDPKSENYMTNDIFEYLLYKGAIQKGTYYIKVSW